MEQLSGQDAMFLHAELEGMPQHIGGVTIYDQSTAEGGKVRFVLLDKIGKPTFGNIVDEKILKNIWEIQKKLK